MDLKLTLERFLDLIRERSLVDPGAPMFVARAPGRLDVMGGIADYSGSLVLQRPIAEATFAAVQRVDDDSRAERTRGGAFRLRESSGAPTAPSPPGDQLV